MALILPYLASTYTANDVFSADTVHSYTKHNTPHQGFMNNDDAIKLYIDGLDDSISSLNASVVALQSASPVGRRLYVLSDDYVIYATNPSLASGTWYPQTLPSNIFPSTITGIIFRLQVVNTWRVNWIGLSYRYPGSTNVFPLSYHSDNDSSGQDVATPLVPITSSLTFDLQMLTSGGYLDFLKITGYVA